MISTLFDAIPCLSKCRNSEDEEERTIEILSIGVGSKFPVWSSECSAKLDTKSIDPPMFASEATEAPYGSMGALTEFSDSTDEEEVEMDMVDSATPIAVALPRLLGREETLYSRLNDGDIVKVPSIDLNSRVDVARACAESAREHALKRIQQIETRRALIKEAQGNANNGREVETAFEVDMVDSATPIAVALPRLLGREETLYSRLNDGDIVKAPSIDLNSRVDVARACAESAREHALKRIQQIETRRALIKEAQGNANNGREVEAAFETFHPLMRTSPFVGLLGSQTLMPRSVRDMCSVLAPCDDLAGLDANCETKCSLDYDIARISVEGRTCAQLALEAFRARKNRIARRSSQS